MAKVSPAEMQDLDAFDDDADDAPEEVPTKKRSAGQKCLKFLFSELGLCLVIIGYTLLGGFLFRAIELSAEKEAVANVREGATRIEESRKILHNDIMDLTQYALTVQMNRSEATAEYKRLLDDYHAQVAALIPDGYDGTVHAAKNDEYSWAMPSSLLFCSSILTTIGYGHVAPASEVGRLVCIIYSVIAIPLMSIFLMKVGKAVSEFIRLVYNKLCCIWCGNRRLRHRKIDRLKQIAEKKEREQNAEFANGANEEETDKLPPNNMKIDWSKYGNPDEMPDGKLWRDDYDATPPVTLVVFMVILYVFIGTVTFTLWEGWSLVSSMYCCFVSLLVIGFGDYVPGFLPKNPANYGAVRTIKLICLSIYIVVGVAIMAMFVDLVIEALSKIDDYDDDDDDNENEEAQDAADAHGDGRAKANGDAAGADQPSGLYSDTVADTPPPVVAAR